MAKAKTTKRALLMSVLSMLLCVSMLVGSTFAWFTDTVTSGTNRIVAGNLDVELYYNNASTEGKWKDASKEKTETPNFFVDNDGNDILWEPGVMAVTQFKVANVGSLALKYSLETVKAGFNSLKDENGVAHDLSEVIRLAVIKNGEYASREQILALNPQFDDFTGFTAAGQLLPEDNKEGKPSEEIFTVVAYWEPNVKDDNLYNVNNGIKTDDDADQLYINIEIKLNATQASVESDSFDPNYDANATYVGEVVKYTFENASDAIAFCPDCYNAGTTAGHADHAKYLIVKDGVAEVPRTGAWLSFENLDWQNNAYALDYDVDLEMLATGAFIAFDAGETTTWKDLQVGFKRTESGIEVYKTLSTNQLNATKFLGEIGEKVHITYRFTPKAKDLMMLATVTDGKHTYTVENTVSDFPSNTVLCWDVYTAEGDGETYAALDNVVFSAKALIGTPERVETLVSAGYTEVKTSEALEEALISPDVDKIVVSEDISVSGPVAPEGNLTIDLNGNNFEAAGRALQITSGNEVVVKNGTLSSKEIAAFCSGGDLTLDNVEIEGSEEFAAVFVGKSGKVNISGGSISAKGSANAVWANSGSNVVDIKGTVITSETHTVVAFEDSTISFENCEISTTGSAAYPIATNGGASKDVVLSIKNSKINSSVGDGWAAYFPAGTVELLDCTVDGAVVITGGDVTIDGGTYTAVGSPKETPYVWDKEATWDYCQGFKPGSGAGHMGDSILIVDRRTNGYELKSVTIKNATFNTRFIDENGVERTAYAIKYVDLNNSDSAKANPVLENNTYNHKLADGTDPVLILE